VSGAFSLAAAQSVLGDTSVAALSAARDSAIMLCWASACFIIALVFTVASQLLYTDPTIRKSLMLSKGPARHQKMVRFFVAVSACVPLGLQLAAVFLLSQSLGLISDGPMIMARYGIIGGVCLMAGTALVMILSDSEGRERYLWCFFQ